MLTLDDCNADSSGSLTRLAPQPDQHAQGDAEPPAAPQTARGVAYGYLHPARMPAFLTLLVDLHPM